MNELIQVGRLVCSSDRLTSLKSSHLVSLASGRAEVDSGIGRGVSLPTVQISIIGFRFILFPARRDGGLEIIQSLTEFASLECSTFQRLLNLARIRKECVLILYWSHLFLDALPNT